MSTEQTFAKIKNARILVVGDIMIDHRVDGNVTRISPEAPVPIHQKKEESFNLGGAGNVAQNLASLGAKVTLLGAIGTDTFGDLAIDIAKQKGIELIAMRDREMTTVKTRYFSGNHYMFRTDSEQSHKVDARTIKEISANILKNKYDAIIASDYDKGVITQELMHILKETDSLILGDPKPKNIHLFKICKYITPNVAELSAMLTYFGKPRNLSNKDDEVLEALLFLKEQIPIHIIVTRSEKGISYLHGDKLVTVPTHIQEIFDVTGAGDSTIAMLACGLAIHLPLHDAVVLANAAGGAAVKRSGVVAVTPQMVVEILQTRQ